MARNGTKTGGRVKGVSVNKTTKEERDRAGRVLDLIESNHLEKDIKQLNPYQRMMVYMDMMEYKAPKLSRQELTGKDGKDLQPQPIMFLSAEKLTEDQIEKYMNQDARTDDESI